MTIDNAAAVDDRYDLGELVGRGGMADVHRATDRRLRRTVAVKILRDRATAETDRARFVAEARTLAQLNHAALVGVYNAGLDDDHPYLVMEYVDGEALSTRLTGAPLPERTVARLGSRIADGLAYAHARGVVHRDVKPGNILVDGGDGAKLADFGIARIIDASGSPTLPGYTVGTPAYLAPEQINGGEVTGATDVYALGLVLLEALTGRKAFRGGSTEAVVARLHTAPRIPADLGSGWVSVLRLMTRRDPADRPTAGQAARWLGELARGGLPDVVQVRPLEEASDADDDAASPAARPRGRRLRRWVGTVAAALGMVAFLGLLAAGWLGFGTAGAQQEEAPARPEVPADVPAEVEGPLSDLHDALYGGSG